MLELTVNGTTVRVDAPDDEPLVWVLRDDLGLPGTRYGCGAGHCGSCTVLMDGVAVRSCQLPASAAVGRDVRTIEGEVPEAGALKHVRAAFLEHQVAQCGWCMTGWQLTLTSLLEANPNLSDEALEAGLQGNLCRCGTYVRIRRAARDAAERHRADLAARGPVLGTES